MSRRKRYTRGRVYLINDSLIVKNTKANRRVVALNNDKNHLDIRRITSLIDSKGNIKQKVIPIEKYPDIRKPSGVENKTYRKTLSGKPIVEEKLRKTNTRLNKWDMNKIIKK